MADAGAPPERVGSTRRERIQQRALREILDAGREEMRLHGPAGVTMRSVARAVDMTPSGLYRHVSGHDELLGLLAADAYEAMGAAMDQAAADAPAGDHATAWYRVMIAMRQWYLDHRAEYELLVSPRLIARPPHRLFIRAGAPGFLLSGGPDAVPAAGDPREHVLELVGDLVERGPRSVHGGHVGQPGEGTLEARGHGRALGTDALGPGDVLQLLREEHVGQRALAVAAERVVPPGLSGVQVVV